MYRRCSRASVNCRPRTPLRDSAQRRVDLGVRADQSSTPPATVPPWPTRSTGPSAPSTSRRVAVAIHALASSRVSGRRSDVGVAPDTDGPEPLAEPVPGKRPGPPGRTTRGCGTRRGPTPVRRSPRASDRSRRRFRRSGGTATRFTFGVKWLETRSVSSSRKSPGSVRPRGARLEPPVDRPKSGIGPGDPPTYPPRRPSSVSGGRGRGPRSPPSRGRRHPAAGRAGRRIAPEPSSVTHATKVITSPAVAGPTRPYGRLWSITDRH
jgi:hypothetical protein